jgi:signal transduction histidine kinase/ligand-binding sensor domain-containing protein
MQRNVGMNLLSNLRLVLRLALWMVCGVAVLAVHAHSQNWNNLGRQSWSTENGLPQNSVHQIFQSRDGYLWIATEGGVARFNGVDFAVFNRENTSAFTSDDICCFAEGANGSLWIGTADGLVRYAAGAFRRYSAAEGLPSGGIVALEAGGHGDLLILTNNGLTRFDGDHFVPLTLPSSAVPSAMAAAHDGSLWIASSEGIFQYQQGGFHLQSFGLTVPMGGVEGIGFLPEDGVWLRTKSSVMMLQNGHLRTLQAGRDIPAGRVQSVLAGPGGDLWIGTDKGLFRLDQAGDAAQLQPELDSDSILSTFQDAEGDLWVGTETSGLDILRRQNFRTMPGLSDHAITAITQTPGGAMWVGTDGEGLDRWQSGETRHFSSSNGLLSDIILALAPDNHDGVWVGTPDGLNHIGAAGVQTYTSSDGLPDDLIRSLLADDDGSLWIGTRRGLAHWQKNRFVTLTRADGLGSDLIGTLLKSHSSNFPHDLWIGTLSGLSRLRDGKITTFTTKDGLSGNIITSLAQDANGRLWIGTKGDGLSTWTPAGFLSLRRRDLPLDIDSILEDDRGDLWLGSSRGIARIPISRLIACGSSPGCSLHALSYGRPDGMPTEETSAIGHPAAWKTKEGLLWFATRKGVAITDPSHLAENRIAPPVAIERFTADDVELPLSTAEQTIAPGHTRFVFQYAGLSYVAPGKVSYRYILDGFDKQWTDAGPRRVAYYTNLPPHHYRFRVQAANNDGTWNETGAAIAFYVRPPFYRRLWFVLLAVVLIAAVAILLYRLRVHRLQSQFQAVLAERSRVAREIHDTLAQSFVGVSVQLELMAQLLAQSQISAAGQQIDRTREYVREGLAEARRSIWDLRANTAQHTLPTRLTHLVEQSNTKQLSIHLTIGGTYRPLAAAFEDEILRIAQESLTNVKRHAEAAHASVDLRYDSSRLRLIISDDGRGFHAADHSLTEQGHFGLQGMRERAAQIHAQLTIESSPGGGTTVVLDAPIVVEKGAANNG